MTFCGCYFTVPSPHSGSVFGTPSPQRQYLPLVSSSFHSTILSNTSRTVLTQKFTNPSKDTAIPECIYTFPLYADVSVVKFTCRIGKKVLYGIVKEKFEAKKIFDEAVAKGETAGLLEQSLEASDVFSTKLGNVPAGESVFVEVTYISELKNGDGDGVRFTIPTSIVPRYGSAPSQSNLVPSLFGGNYRETVLSESEAGIKIVVDINIPDGSFIKGVQSPSHPISISMGTVSTAAEDHPTMSKASATLALGSAALEKDFVLIVQSKNSGIPRAILETHPTIPNQRALMTTLVPKFTLPPSRPELVFVADRSGSMGGNIPTLISALKVFLKSMPAGVKFNICSFGSSCQFLWPKSRTYDAGTLKEASDHVETFAANFGGTETFGAVKATIERRWTDLKLDIILLTDGDIWGQDQMFKYLTEQTEASNGKIRVFPLGIGNGVSHALIEGIARAGNGFAQAVQNGERLDTAVVKMLRGALTPHITDYSLEVKYAKEDDDFEVIDKVTDGMKVLLVAPNPAQKQTISLFDTTAEPEKADMESSDPKLPEIPTPKLLQAPHKIPSLFAFSRTTAYILMSPETFHRNPTSVIFRATSEHGPLELEIPIEALAQPGKTIHQLAAKKATQDMEEGRGWIYEAKDQNGQLIKERYPSSFDDLVKKECVRLGEKYQVAGKWCSFVAVAENQDTSTTPAPQNKNPKGQDLSNPPGNMDVLQDFDFDSFLHGDGDVSFDFDSVAPRAEVQDTSNFDNEFSSNAQANPAGNHDLQDYQMQIMLLEQQNKKRLMMARQEQDNKQPGAPTNMSVQSSGSTQECQAGLQQQQAQMMQQQVTPFPQSQPETQNQGPQHQQKQGGQLFASFASSTPPITQNSLFGNPSTTPLGSSGRSVSSGQGAFAFGASSPAPTQQGLFGNQSNNNPLGSLSQMPTQQTGGLFGNTRAAPPSTGSLFGSSQTSVPQSQQSGGTFGGFGNQSTGGGLFGSAQPQVQQSGGLFGGLGTSSTQPPLNPTITGSLFGSGQTQAQSGGGGLFGGFGGVSQPGSSLGPSQNQAKPSGGMIGRFPVATQPQYSMSAFGSQSPGQKDGALSVQARSTRIAPPPPPSPKSLFSSVPAYSPTPQVEKPDWKIATNEQKIHALIELQTFDGAWLGGKESEILEILGIGEGGHPEGIDGTIWITLVVVGVLERKMAEEEGTWALVVEKAKNWLDERENDSPSEMKKARESLKI